MRHPLVWLALGLVGCVDRSFVTTEIVPARCEVPNLYEVSVGEPVQLDWTELVLNLNAEGEPPMEVDRVILGRLPVSWRQLMRCRPLPDFDWIETLEVEPGTLTLELSPEQVGTPGTSTIVTLRALDEEVASVALIPRADLDETTVEF